MKIYNFIDTYYLEMYIVNLTTYSILGQGKYKKFWKNFFNKWKIKYSNRILFNADPSRTIADIVQKIKISLPFNIR